MNYGKAVEEVWKWREESAKKTLAVPRNERVKYINDSALATCKKLGIKCRRTNPRIKEYA